MSSEVSCATPSISNSTRSRAPFSPREPAARAKTLSASMSDPMLTVTASGVPSAVLSAPASASFTASARVDESPSAPASLSGISSDLISPLFFLGLKAPTALNDAPSRRLGDGELLGLAASGSFFVLPGAAPPFEASAALAALPLSPTPFPSSFSSVSGARRRRAASAGAVLGASSAGLGAVAGVLDAFSTALRAAMAVIMHVSWPTGSFSPVRRMASGPE